MSEHNSNSSCTAEDSCHPLIFKESESQECENMDTNSQPQSEIDAPDKKSVDMEEVHRETESKADPVSNVEPVTMVNISKSINEAASTEAGDSKVNEIHANSHKVKDDSMETNEKDNEKSAKMANKVDLFQKIDDGDTNPTVEENEPESRTGRVNVLNEVSIDEGSKETDNSTSMSASAPDVLSSLSTSVKETGGEQLCNDLKLESDIASEGLKSSTNIANPDKMASQTLKESGTESGNIRSCTSIDEPEKIAPQVSPKPVTETENRISTDIDTPEKISPQMSPELGLESGNRMTSASLGKPEMAPHVSPASEAVVVSRSFVSEDKEANIIELSSTAEEKSDISQCNALSENVKIPSGITVTSIDDEQASANGNAPAKTEEMVPQDDTSEADPSHETSLYPVDEKQMENASDSQVNDADGDSDKPTSGEVAPVGKPVYAEAGSSRSRVTRSRNPDFSAKQRSFMKEYQRSVSRGSSSAAVLGTIEGEKRAGSEELATPPVGKRRRIAETPETLKSSAIAAGNNLAHDSFCWSCHCEGEVLHCNTCPRGFHRKCASVGATAQVPDTWRCAECHRITNADQQRDIPQQRLTQLMKYAIGRLKSLPGAEPFIKPVDQRKFPAYREFIAVPMSLSTMQAQLDAGRYLSTVAFVADCKWILHNCILFNGVGTKLTTLAKSLLRMCKWEMEEIETCPDCYGNAYTTDNWFIEACPRPHLLVWARLKGFPFWPAKAMKARDGNVDCRFFGRHDRAWVPVKECFLFSKDPPATPKGKTKSLDSCIEELFEHVKKLEKRFGKYHIAKNKTQLKPERMVTQLKLTLPGYTEPALPPPKVTTVPVNVKRGSTSRKRSPETEDRPPDEKRARTTGAAAEAVEAAPPVDSSDETAASEPAPGLKGTPVKTKECGSGNDSAAAATVKKEPSESGIQTEKDSVSSNKPSLDGETLSQITTSKNSSLIAKKVADDEGRSQAKADQPCTPDGEPDDIGDLVIDESENDSGAEQSKPAEAAEKEKTEEGSENLIAMDGDRDGDTCLRRSDSMKSDKSSGGKSSSDNEFKANTDSDKSTSKQAISKANECVKKSASQALNPKPKPSTNDKNSSNTESLTVSEKRPRGRPLKPKVSLTNNKNECTSSVKIANTTSKESTERKAEVIGNDKVLSGNDKTVGTIPPGVVPTGNKTPIVKLVKRESMESLLSMVAKSASSATPTVTVVSSSSEARLSWSSRRKTARKSLGALTIGSSAPARATNVLLTKPFPGIVGDKTATVAAKSTTSARRSSTPGTATATTPSSVTTPTGAATTIVVPARGGGTRLTTSRAGTTGTAATSTTSVVLVNRSPVHASAQTRLTTLTTSKSTGALPLQVQTTGQIRPKAWTSTTVRASLPAGDSAAPGPVVVSSRRGEAARLMIPHGSGLYIPAGAAGQTSAPMMVIPQNGLVTLPVTSTGVATGGAENTTQTASQTAPVSTEIARQANSLADLMREGVERYLRERAGAGDAQASAATLQLEMERRDWRHKAEISELNRKHEAQLAQARAAADQEQKRAMSRLAMSHAAERADWERRLEQRVADTKRKQWCAECGKEAIFYCCWNTSYCDFPCQEKQWPKHMLTCANQQGGNVDAGGGDVRIG